MQSRITPNFSVTWSFRNHFIMLIWLKKHFLLLSILKTVVLLIVFVEKCGFFSILWCIKCSKEQYLLDIKIFCNIFNDITVTFDLNLNKSIDFFNGNSSVLHILSVKTNKQMNKQNLCYRFFISFSILPYGFNICWLNTCLPPTSSDLFRLWLYDVLYPLF